VLNIAQQLDKPNDLAFAEHAGAVLSVFLRDAAELRLRAAALASLAATRNFPFYSATSQIFTGRVMLNEGKVLVGLAALRRGVSDYIAAGTRIGLGLFLGMLAEAEADAGLLEEALRTVGDAIVSTVEEGAWQPYLLWVKGRLLLDTARLSGSQSTTDGSEAGEGLEKAEQTFRDAIAFAERIGAKTIQLRAATALTKLLVSRGSAREASHLLAPLYPGFTQGQETADLVEARQALDELKQCA